MPTTVDVMSAHLRRHTLAALGMIALAVPIACSSDDSGGAVDDSAAATSSVAATTPTPVTEATTGPLTGAARASCGPLTAEQLEPMAAVLRSRLPDIDGVEVGTSADSPGFLLVTAPPRVSDAQIAAVCALPRFDVRPVLDELPTDSTTGTAVGETTDDDVFANEFANRRFRLGPVVADATTFNPNAIAQEIHATGWLVTTTLTADGAAAWSTALAACFGRTADCPTGELAYLVEDLVVVTGNVLAPLNESATFSLPGTWSEETTKRLAALISIAAEGSFGPAAG